MNLLNTVILEASFLSCGLAQEFVQYTCSILNEVKTDASIFPLLESVRQQKLSGNSRFLHQGIK